MARPRIAVCVLALLIAEWPGAAQARRHLAHKRGRPVGLDPEPAVRLQLHRTTLASPSRGVSLGLAPPPCTGVASSVFRLCSATCCNATVPSPLSP